VTNTTPLITLAGIELLDLGLPVAGTLAVLLRAKQYGVIATVRPYIMQMQNQGRRFHPDLLARLLEDAGE
jgi:predicted nucleic acid-binding protein